MLETKLICIDLDLTMGLFDKTEVTLFGSGDELRGVDAGEMRPDLFVALDYFRSTNHKIAVTSRRSTDSAVFVAKRTGLRAFVDDIYGQDRMGVSPGKNYVRPAHDFGIAEADMADSLIAIGDNWMQDFPWMSENVVIIHQSDGWNRSALIWREIIDVMQSVGGNRFYSGFIELSRLAARAGIPATYEGVNELIRVGHRTWEHPNVIYREQSPKLRIPTIEIRSPEDHDPDYSERVLGSGLEK